MGGFKGGSQVGLGSVCKAIFHKKLGEDKEIRRTKLLQVIREYEDLLRLRIIRGRSSVESSLSF